ncbi:Uncharacterised protein [Mycobacteroides abscessus subsp. abscessus]|nr:Uncharacterised protein [Mycobacteroides abscessus subsp. abscessus]
MPSPSSTITATLSELDSWKTFPICVIALTDGASGGLSETECSRSTISSGGTLTVSKTVIASQPRIMKTAPRRIMVAIIGRCDLTLPSSALMRPSRGTR